MIVSRVKPSGSIARGVPADCRVAVLPIPILDQEFSPAEAFEFFIFNPAHFTYLRMMLCTFRCATE